MDELCLEEGILIKEEEEITIKEEEDTENNTSDTSGMEMKVVNPINLKLAQNDETGCCVSTSAWKNRQNRPVCNLSYKTFQHGSQMKRLYQTQKTKKKKYSCSFCGERFLQKGQLVTHNILHWAKKPHMCHKCGEHFPKMANLEMHLLTHQEKESHGFGVCREDIQLGLEKDKKLPKFGVYRENSQLHFEAKSQKFGICRENSQLHSEEEKSKNVSISEEDFQLRSDLLQHPAFHRNKDSILVDFGPYRCKVCNKKFDKRCQLEKHSLIHSGVKPHTCTTCNKAFSDKSNLMRHELLHKEVKPFRCVLCEKEFTQGKSLEKHMQIHIQVKPHRCDICDESFLRKHELERHLLTHPGMKLYICVICGKSFSKKCLLEQHTLIHAKEMETCESRWLTTGNVTSHSRYKPHVSEILEGSLKREIPSLGIADNIEALDNENDLESNPLSVLPKEEVHMALNMGGIVKKEEYNPNALKEAELVVEQFRDSITKEEFKIDDFDNVIIKPHDHCSKGLLSILKKENEEEDIYS